MCRIKRGRSRRTVSSSSTLLRANRDTRGEGSGESASSVGLALRAKRETRAAGCGEALPSAGLPLFAKLEDRSSAGGSSFEGLLFAKRDSRAAGSGDAPCASLRQAGVSTMNKSVPDFNNAYTEVGHSETMPTKL